MEDSVGFSNLNRQVASYNPDEEEAKAWEQKFGLVDAKGASQTDSSLQHEATMKEAKVQQIQGLLDKEKTPAPAPGFGTPRPGEDITGMNKESVPSQVLGGVADATQSMVNFGIEFGNYIDNKLGDGKLIPDDLKASYADRWFPQSDYTGNRLMRGAVQFVVPYAGISKGLKVAGIANAAIKTGLAGTAANFLGFEGDQDRISNLVQSVPELANPLTEYLSHKPGDPAIEGRFKNVVEGVGLGAMTDATFAGLRFLKSKFWATKAISAVEGAPLTPAVEGVVPKAPVDAPMHQVVQTNPMEPSAAEVLNPNPELASGKQAAGQPNISKINVSQDTKSVIKNVAEADKNVQDVVRGKFSFQDEIQKIEEGAGASLEDILKRPVGTALNPQEATAVRVAHATAAEDLKTAAQKALVDNSPEAHADMMDKLQYMRLLGFVRSGAATDASRVLNSFKQSVHPSERTAEQLTLAAKAWGEDNVNSIAQKISTFTEPQMDKFVEKTRWKALNDAAEEVFKTNLITAPRVTVKAFGFNFHAANLAAAEKWIAPWFKGTAKDISPENVKSLLARQRELTFKPIEGLNPEQYLAHTDELSGINKQLGTAVNAYVAPGEAKDYMSSLVKNYGNQAMSNISAFGDMIHSLYKSALQIDGKSVSQLGRDFLEEAKSGHIDPITKAEGLPPAVTAENFALDPKSYTGMALDGLGGIQRLMGKGVVWADNFYKSSIDSAEKHALAFRLADMQGLKGQEAEQFMTGFLNDLPEVMKRLPPDELHPVQEAASKLAERVTLTSPLEGAPQSLSKFIRETGFADIYPLRFVAAFPRTGLNEVVNYGTAYVPAIARLTTDYKEAMLQGGAAAQTAKAREALGTMFLTAGGMLAWNGNLTGGGPNNPKSRRLLEDTGWKPYSLKMGDKFVPYKDLMGPVGKFLGLAADFSEILSNASHKDIDVDSVGQHMNLAAWAMVKFMTPELLTDQFGKLFEAMDQKDISKLTSDIAPNLIPLAGAAKVARRFEDPYKRDTAVSDDLVSTTAWLQEVINKTKDTIPGLSRSLPARKNIWGEDVTYPQGLGPDVVNPFYASKLKKDDNVTPELVRLGYAGPLTKPDLPGGETNLSISMPRHEFVVEKGHVDLNGKQYSRYVELCAGLGLEQGPYAGKTLKQTLGEVIQDNYSGRIFVEDQKTDENKRIVIKDIISKYRKSANQQMIQEFPDLADKAHNSIELQKKARGLQ